VIPTAQASNFRPRYSACYVWRTKRSSVLKRTCLMVFWYCFQIFVHTCCYCSGVSSCYIRCTLINPCILVCFRSLLRDSVRWYCHISQQAYFLLYVRNCYTWCIQVLRYPNLFKKKITHPRKLKMQSFLNVITL